MELKIIVLIVITSTLNYEPILAEEVPRKIYCSDQSNMKCEIVNTILPKNNANFQLVSENPMNVVILNFEFASSVIPRFGKEICNAFPNLRRINAMHSMIEELDEDSLVNCVNLELIDFGHNKISHLSKNTFNRNVELHTISLHDNKLAVLDVDLFKDLSHMRRLVLSLNDVEEVPVALFRDLKNLAELTLHHNFLIDLDAEQLVKYCPKLSMIHLRDNYFGCERLRTIINVLTKANVRFWTYADKLRSRNYTLEFVDQMECLNWRGAIEYVSGSTTTQHS